MRIHHRHVTESWMGSVSYKWTEKFIEDYNQTTQEVLRILREAFPNASVVEFDDWGYKFADTEEVVTMFKIVTVPNRWEDITGREDYRAPKFTFGVSGRSKRVGIAKQSYGEPFVSNVIKVENFEADLNCWKEDNQRYYR